MSEYKNDRLTYSNQINRVRVFVQSTEFLRADLVILEHRKQRLEEAFANFTEAHRNVVKDVKPADFPWEDQEFAKVDEIYSRLIIDFNRRIKTVEIDEHLERLEQKDEEKQTAKKRKAKPILEFVREKEQNKVLYCDGTKQYVPLNKRAYMVFSSDEEEEEAESEKKDDEKTYDELSDDDDDSEKSENSNKRTVRSAVVEIDLREKIIEKAAQIEQIKSEINKKKSEMKPNANEKESAPKRVIVCNNCGGNHQMRKCEKFLRLKKGERWRRVQAIRVCPNCFMVLFDRRHNCREGPCKCGQWHNSLLC